MQRLKVVSFSNDCMRLYVLLTRDKGSLPYGRKRPGGKMIGRMKNGSGIIRTEESKGRRQPRVNEKKREARQKLIV